MLVTAAVVCLTFVSLMSGQGQATPEPTADEAAVRALVARYVDARERADEAATRALFTSDADQLVSSGEWRRGLAEVVNGTMASSRSNSGARTIEVESVRIVAPGVAIADGRYTIAASGATPARQMWTSFVVVKAGQDWRISAIRNMLPAPAAAPAK